MSKKIKIFLKILITIFLFYIIFRKVDFQKFLTIIVNANLWYYIIICLLWPVGILINSFKWNLILKEYKVTISHRKTFDLYWIGSFFNNFLPSSVGGDAYKFIFLNKYLDNKKAQIVSSIILDRGIGSLSILFYILVFGLFFTQTILNNIIISITYLCDLILILMIPIIILLSKKVRVKENFRFSFINKLVKGINILISFKNWRVLLVSFLLSLIFLFLVVLSYYFAFKAFHFQISFLLLLFLVPLINLSGVIPFSVNSLGIREGIGIYLYSFFNIPSEITLSVLLISRVFSVFCSLTGGIRYLSLKYDEQIML